MENLLSNLVSGAGNIFDLSPKEALASVLGNATTAVNNATPEWFATVAKTYSTEPVATPEQSAAATEQNKPAGEVIPAGNNTALIVGAVALVGLVIFASRE